MSLASESALQRLAVETAADIGLALGQAGQVARTPIRGSVVATIAPTEGVDDAVQRAADAFKRWRTTPAPTRGSTVARLGALLRANKDGLATLVALEAGKIMTEARGEIQEMIDICDLAVGLSRQLFGLTIASERPDHRLSELWHPLGPVGVITAFNFPAAVWAWNAALAIVCGDPVIWKPSDNATLVATAIHVLANRAAIDTGAPADLFTLVLGGTDTASELAEHVGVPLVSATGSTSMGRALAPRIAARFGRALLELGGNNAAIMAPSADVELAVRAVTFAAAGTAGQRCTTLRRLIVHRSRRDEVLGRLARTYENLPVGDPLDPHTLVGPLIDATAFRRFDDALRALRDEGGDLVVGGGRELGDDAPDAFYVRPAIATMPRQTELVRTETFGPLLYLLTYDTLDEAIALNNDVPQGLASSIFTNDMREAERFTGPNGSDCGIANVNIGPSGAEIGGAFGGEKETGGGRESGSDAWKAYMRRSTATVNYGNDLPLAQGVRFG